MSIVRTVCNITDPTEPIKCIYKCVSFRAKRFRTELLINNAFISPFPTIQSRCRHCGWYSYEYRLEELEFDCILSAPRSYTRYCNSCYKIIYPHIVSNTTQNERAIHVLNKPHYWGVLDSSTGYVDVLNKLGIGDEIWWEFLSNNPRHCSSLVLAICNKKNWFSRGVFTNADRVTSYICRVRIGSSQELQYCVVNSVVYFLPNADTLFVRTLLRKQQVFSPLLDRQLLMFSKNM